MDRRVVASVFTSTVRPQRFLVVFALVPQPYIEIRVVRLLGHEAGTRVAVEARTLHELVPTCAICSVLHLAIYEPDRSTTSSETEQGW